MVIPGTPLAQDGGRFLRSLHCIHATFIFIITPSLLSAHSHSSKSFRTILTCKRLLRIGSVAISEEEREKYFMSVTEAEVKITSGAAEGEAAAIT